MEKLLLEACLEVVKSDALVGIQDMGAAGLTSSSAEMASKGGFGIEMNLDLVPQREAGMTPYEMMLSESQERMLLVVKQGREQEIYELFAKYGLEAKAIGKVTDDKMLRLYFRGEVVAEIPVDALAKDAPVYHKPSKEPAYYREFQAMEPYVPAVSNYEETLLSLLAQPTIASKEWVYQQYDYMVRTNTVVAPGSDAAVLRIRGNEQGAGDDDRLQLALHLFRSRNGRKNRRGGSGAKRCLFRSETAGDYRLLKFRQSRETRNFLAARKSR